MLLAGFGWGLYSIVGKFTTDPLASTTGNFVLALVPTMILLVIFQQQIQWDAMGVALAATSGALTSGIGYALWYSVLPRMRSMTAAGLQLTVPILTTLGAILFLGESISIVFVTSTLMVLAGIGLYLVDGRRAKPTRVDTSPRKT
jgi:drug/metabolite transporter (DMT)-like permease